MLNGIVMIAAGVWGELFSERQVYLRSHGRVRYVSLSPLAQFSGFVFFLLAFSWAAFASAGFAYYHGNRTVQDARYQELSLSHKRLIAELAQAQQRIRLVELEIDSNKRQQTKQTQQQTLNETPSGTPVPSMAKAPEPLPTGVTDSNISVIPGAMPRPRPQMQPGENVNQFHSSVMPLKRPNLPVLSLPSSMTTLGGRLENGQAPLAGSLTGYTVPRNEVMAYLAGDANTAIAAFEKLINQTGLDAETMLRRSTDSKSPGGQAKGGPLLSMPPSTSVKFMRRMAPGELAMPDSRKGRLELLREALFSLPLAEPVNKYYVSSRYGYRRDPFTRAKAFHSGVDLVAPHGDPVQASAPGVVVFAGPNGPYGNMVDIDHGRGVKSRYGHLSRINVKLGQKVGLRQTIGLVGNTGRSGTAHLHFEVWFDGKARDPRNFLKAGENVFQRKG